MSLKIIFLLTGAVPMWAWWAIIMFIGARHYSVNLAWWNVLASIGTTLLGVWIHTIWVGLGEKK